jgi:hypothetical protein
MIPASVTIGAGHLASRGGSVAPEAVYRFLPLDTPVPRETSLLRQLGPGSWIWTSARVISVDQAADQTRLVLAYPIGVPYEFVVQGIKAFTQVRLHGIPWHTDPTYARYSDGWAYDSTTQTFYAKITGRLAQEELDILY